MVNILEKSAKDLQLQKTLSMLARFQQNGDEIRAEKAIKLVKKIYDNEFIIAFSGHFSAGKSTMINALIGDQILPSSPIPTSANLVKVISSNEDYAKVYSQSQKTLLFKAPYDFSTVKDYCKNGGITNIEIGKAVSHLPKGITVMDTPGVDSTDDAHRISTESALHLADIVFYVMDYNHVQSELNFMYTKELLKHGVKLYLIINQIDKHNDKELTFSAFKQSVHDSFASWSVEPAGIFFTTLKKPNHQENEFESVKALIDHTFSNHHHLMKETIEAAWKRLTGEHEIWLNEEMETHARQFEQIMMDYTDEEIANLFNKEKELTEIKEKLEQTVANWEKNFEEERETLLKNAYLMPYETRAAAEQYLISAQQNFKSGFLFSKKKTEAEREARLATFFKSVKKQVESQIDWHLSQLAIAKLGEMEINDSVLQASAQKIAVEFNKILLKEAIHKGAGMTGEYVLHYCEEVTSRINRLAIKETDPFKTAVSSELKRKINNELQRNEIELRNIKKAASALQSLIEIEKTYDEKKSLIYTPTGDEMKLLHSYIDFWEAEASEVNIVDHNVEQIHMPVSTNDHEILVSEIEQISTIHIDKMILKLDEAVTALSDVKGFQRITEQLSDKCARLKNQNFTISLFGAFSAGKSSFANALLGENILPVSPNPTTAAINRICPPTNKHGHGTAVVSLKQPDQLLLDIQESLSKFGYESKTLEEAYSIIPNIITNKQGDGKDKIHLSFLSAFMQGFELHKEKLGKAINTNLKEFQDYVANETKSCFVEAIDLFYDCPFTKRGITLVDTPGADSINARHTGVAFEYIKNSDAILFVTYYNHAFSKADREFLIQLGRVKDAFELDKMFFIVNAIDLASSNEEVSEVLTYVKNELYSNGIRFPRIFGVSSKLALIDEQAEASNIAEFKAAFNQFLDNDLTEMAIKSAEIDYNRAVFMLDQLINAANEDENIKAERKTTLVTTKTGIEHWLGENDSQILMERLFQETKELLFYVKQRVFYRFPDFFKEAFNPATLQGNNRGQLRNALEELLSAVGYDFAQEMRATSLRMEHFKKRILKERFSAIEKELQIMQPEITLSQLQFSKGISPEFLSAFSEIDRKPLEVVFKHFRNSKAFFENNEKKQMEEKLHDLLSPMADEYIAAQLTKINDHYEEILVAEFSTMIESICKDVDEQYDAWISALEDSDKLSEWRNIRSVLSKLS